MCFMCLCFQGVVEFFGWAALQQVAVVPRFNIGTGMAWTAIKDWRIFVRPIMIYWIYINDYNWLESKVLTSELVSAFWLCWSGKKTTKNAWLRWQASPRFAADSTRLKPNHMRVQGKSGSNKFMLIFYVKQIWSPDIAPDFSYQGCLIKS